MAERQFRVKDILKLNSLNGVRLVAGSEGLNSIVSNMNVMEVPDVIDWVQPYEFLMTTGYQYRDAPDQFAELIPLLKEKKVSALGIKPERFIARIPESVIRAADSCGFPLFELPAQTSFSMVIREAMEKILIYDIRHEENFVYQMLHADQISENDLISAARVFGIDLDVLHTFYIILPYRTTAEGQHEDSLLKNMLKNIFLDSGCHPLSMIYHENLLLLVITESEEFFDDIIRKKKESLDQIALDNHICLCVSEPCHSVRLLNGVYRNTNHLCMLLNTLPVRDSIITWSSMGVYSILPYIENTPYMSHLFSQYIHPLLDYDSEHQTHLFQTLEKYLECNGNMKTASKELYIHYNTMCYRINAIQEKMRWNLEDYNSLTEINLAFKLYAFTREYQ